VGRHALQYGDDFDGRLSTSKRVRATRVRRALRQYYQGAGVGDDVRIELPLARTCPGSPGPLGLCLGATSGASGSGSSPPTRWARTRWQGSVVLRPDTLRLAARVTDAISGEVTWSTVATIAGHLLADAAESWAEAVVGQLIEPGGVLFRAAAAASGGTPDGLP